MWNPMAAGQAYNQNHDPNAWGQQAALWTQQQQQQQQQQMWNQNMWNPQMAPPMGPPMDPNMMQNMGGPMGPNMSMPVNQYGMMDPQQQQWAHMNMGQQNWNCGPQMQQYPMQGAPHNQQNQVAGNWGGYNASIAQPAPVPPVAAAVAPVAPVASTPSVISAAPVLSKAAVAQKTKAAVAPPKAKVTPSIEKEKAKENPAPTKTVVILPDIPEEQQPQVEALQIYGVVPANRRTSQHVSNTGMGFYCEICECYISSLTNAETHIRGGRHKQNKRYKDVDTNVMINNKRNLQADTAEDTMGRTMPSKKQKTAEGNTEQRTPENARVDPEKAPAEEEIYFDVLNGEAKIQGTLDALEDPVIGLNEIVEHQIKDNSLPAYYICKPCNVRLNANNLMFHIKGLRHRLSYMQTLKPDEAKEIEQKRHHEQVTMINKLTADMESQLGRGRVQVVVDHDTSHHPYSIRMAIKEREGHVIKIAKVDEKKGETLGPANKVAQEGPAQVTKPTALESSMPTKSSSTSIAGTVVGTKIIVRPDGTKVRVKTVLRAKSTTTKPEESENGSKPKTAVTSRASEPTPEGTEVVVTKTATPSGKILIRKKIIKRAPTTPDGSYVVGLNDQPLVFGATASVAPLSQMETSCQTDELLSSFILEKLKRFRIKTEEDAKNVSAIIDALSEAMTQYKLYGLPPTLKDAALESASMATILKEESDSVTDIDEKVKVETNADPVTKIKEETDKSLESGNIETTIPLENITGSLQPPESTQTVSKPLEPIQSVMNKFEALESEGKNDAIVVDESKTLEKSEIIKENEAVKQEETIDDSETNNVKVNKLVDLNDTITEDGSTPVVENDAAENNLKANSELEEFQSNEANNCVEEDEMTEEEDTENNGHDTDVKETVGEKIEHHDLENSANAEKQENVQAITEKEEGNSELGEFESNEMDCNEEEDEVTEEEGQVDTEKNEPEDAEPHEDISTKEELIENSADGEKQSIEANEDTGTKEEAYHELQKKNDTNVQEEQNIEAVTEDDADAEKQQNIKAVTEDQNEKKDDAAAAEKQENIEAATEEETKNKDDANAKKEENIEAVTEEETENKDDAKKEENIEAVTEEETENEDDADAMKEENIEAVTEGETEQKVSENTSEVREET